MIYIFLLPLILFSITNIKSMEEKTETIELKAKSLSLKELRKLAHDGQESGFIWALNYSPNGKELAIAHDDTVQIWDCHNEKVLHTLEISKLPMSVNFSDDAKKLVLTENLVFYNTNIKIWDIENNECQTLEDYFHSSDANTCFSNGTLCLHAQAESKPTIWNIEKKEPICTFKNNDILLGLAVASNNKECAMGGVKRIVKIFDIETQTLLRKLKKSPNSAPASINTVAYSPDNRYLISGQQYQEGITVWDTQSGKIIEEIKQDVSTLAVACSSDNNTIAYSLAGDNEIHYFKINSGKGICSLS